MDVWQKCESAVKESEIFSLISSSELQSSFIKEKIDILRGKLKPISASIPNWNDKEEWWSVSCELSERLLIHKRELLLISRVLGELIDWIKL